MLVISTTSITTVLDTSTNGMPVAIVTQASVQRSNNKGGETKAKNKNENKDKNEDIEESPNERPDLSKLERSGCSWECSTDGGTC